MDKLDDFAETLRARVKEKFDLKASKLTLQEKISQQLNVIIDGGLFRATPELISFVAVWDQEEIFLKDLYDRPVKLNRAEALEKLKSTYQCAMNAWHVEFQKLQTLRKPEDV